MQILPIDIVSLVATVLGISIVLIPVLGLTARYALSPTVTALSKLFDSKSREESLRILERRVELQEQEIAMLTQTVRSLSEAQDFDRALQRGGDSSGRAGTSSGDIEHAAPVDPGHGTQ